MKRKLEVSRKAFTWEELATWRWGPAKDVPMPGLIVDRPDAEVIYEALMLASDQDPEAIAEREAIIGESE